MEKTTLYLPTDLLRQLKAQSVRSGRSQAELIREALVRFLAEGDRPHSRSRGALQSTDLTSENHEDWLRKHWQPDDAGIPG